MDDGQYDEFGNFIGILEEDGDDGKEDWENGVDNADEEDDEDEDEDLHPTSDGGTFCSFDLPTPPPSLRFVKGARDMSST